MSTDTGDATMTSDEWRTATDPQAMLEFLRGTAGDRKLRLFACGCCRRIWHLVEDPRSRQGIEVSERLAEGVTSDAELEHARQNARDAANEDWDRWALAIEAAGGDRGDGYGTHQGHQDACAATNAFFNATTPWSVVVAADVLDAVSHAADPSSSFQFVPARTPEARAAVRREAAVLAALLRCVFGDPFAPVPFDPAWRTETAVTLAAGIYKDRAFERLPILADAASGSGVRGGGDPQPLSRAGAPRPRLLGGRLGAGEGVRGNLPGDANPTARPLLSVVGNRPQRVVG